MDMPWHKLQHMDRIGMKELQANLAATVKTVVDRHPVVLTKVNLPVAVLLSFDAYAGLCGAAGHDVETGQPHKVVT